MTNPSAYYDLAVVVLFTGLMWIPYTLALIKHDGLGVAIGNRETLPALPPWAGRAKRAHLNAVENLVLFAPALLGALAVDANAQAVAQATHVYVGARVVHYLAYVAGITFVRTLAFVAGLAATFYLAFLILP